MTDFDWDVKQRKDLARQSRYVKRGSKSKKCSLPSDGMTRAEWIRKCGEVTTMVLNKPVEWEEFKMRPAYMRREYLADLVKRYACTRKNVAEELFNIPTVTLGSMLHREGWNGLFPQSNRGKLDRDAWDKFLMFEGDLSPIKEKTDLATTSETVECPDNAAETSIELDAQAEDACFFKGETKREERAVTMSKLSMEFSGEISANDVYNSIKMLLNGRKGKLTVSFEEG